MRPAAILFSLLRPTSLVRASFLALGTGIAANALFLQPEHHPAPLFATRDAALELPAPVMTPQVVQPPPAPTPDELVLAIQSALQGEGLYGGPIDGLIGPQTRAAIEAFERAAGRTPTGLASFELLGELNAPTEAEQGDAAIAPPADPDPRLQVVQAALARAAYGPLPADGIFGPQTRDAIARFQSDHGLPVTGEYSEELLVELAALGALEEE